MSKIRKSILSLLFVATLFFSAAFFAGRITARADGAETGLSAIAGSSFVMEKGASIRADRQDGLRYSATLSKEAYDKLAEKYGEDKISFGTFILPEYYVLHYGAPNAENCFGENPVYVWGTDACGENQHIILHNTSKSADFREKDNNYVAEGYVIGMKGETRRNLNVTYSGYVYLKAENADGTSEYLFAGQNDNERSMLLVACKALEAPDNEEYHDILNAYLTTYKEYCTENDKPSKFNYTVKIVKDGAEASSEKLSGELFAEIDKTADFGETDGYVLDKAASKLVGRVYPDGSLTITANYKKKVVLDNPVGKNDYFYFAKETESTADYANAFVKDGYYDIDVSAVSGEISSVAVKGVLDAFTAEKCYRADIVVADYVITTAEEFRTVLTNLAVNKSESYITLANDIYNAGEVNPLSTKIDDFWFRGTFDGRGYTVSDMTINGYGLFVQIAPLGTVKNVAIVNANQTQNSGGAILCGWNYGTIENVYVQGNAAGHSGLTITCTDSAKVISCIVNVHGTHNEGWWYTVGGVIAGSASISAGATVENCYGISDNFAKGLYPKDGVAVTDGFYATAAELLNAFSGTLPEGFGEYWSIKDGKLYFGNGLISEKKKKLAPPRRGKQLGKVRFTEHSGNMDYKEKLKELSEREKITLLTGYDGFSAVTLPEKNINGIKTADGPFGLKTQTGDTLCYPNTCLAACSWDAETCRVIGDYLGRDCVNHGVDLLLAPAINIKRNPLGGRNFEYYSEDPVLTANLAAGFVKGVKSNGVAVCLKHFACNNQEKNRWVYNCVISDDALRNLYLKAFEILIKSTEIDCVMAAYNRINGVYCCENPYLLKKILREEWGYDGVVVSDWCAADDIVGSFKNGLDLEMPANASATVPALEKALQNGIISQADVDEKAGRLLKLYYKIKSSLKRRETDEKEKAAVLRKLTGECFVLLKNEDGVLPIDREKKVLLVGAGAVSPKIQGGGCAKMNTRSVQIPYKEIKKYCSRCDVIADYDVSAVNVSDYDNIIMFLGLSDDSDSESIDRTTAAFPQVQLDCIKKLSEQNENVIAVLQNGGAMDLSFEPQAKAVLETYYAGSFCGGAIADVLFGITNPCGKLAETFPLSFEASPSTKEDDGDDVDYSEGEFVGYGYYSSFGVKTRYPFGYGLSYSEYKVSDIEITRTGEYAFVVSARVKNESAFAGKYVLQVYLKSYDGFTPALRLADFGSVRLEANGEKKISLVIEKESFGRYVGGKKKLVTGSCGICVAESSEKLLLEKKFDFCGDCKKDGERFTRRTLTGTLLKDERYRDIALSYMGKSIADWAFGAEAAKRERTDFEKDAFLKNSVYNMPIRAFRYFGQNDFDEKKEKEMLNRLNAVCR